MKMLPTYFVAGFAIIAISWIAIQWDRKSTPQHSQVSPEQTYTPPNAPVFVGQLHSNVVVSTNGGRTVFVTK